jgi:hypothetical protein
MRRFWLVLIALVFVCFTSAQTWTYGETIALEVSKANMPDSIKFYADDYLFGTTYVIDEDTHETFWRTHPPSGVYLVQAELYHNGEVLLSDAVHMSYTQSADTSGRTFTTQEPYPARVVLAEPEHNATDVSIDVILRWGAVTFAEYYQLQVTTGDYANSFIDVIVHDTEYQLHGLEYLTTYHWRVRAVNQTGAGEWSGE